MSWGRMRPPGRPKPMPPPTPVPVVVIDEDDDSEVFIINDPAEIFRAEAACNTKKGNSSGSNVINLDDDDEDEDDDGGGGGDRAGPSMAGAGGSPAMATPPGRASPRNRYGLNYVSDSEQSDLSEGSDSDSDGDGSSDCEILPPVSARKLWESAASRRTTPHEPPQRRKDGRASTSASSAESSTHHDENLDDLFASGHPQDDKFWEYYGFNPAGPSSSGRPLDDNFWEPAFNPVGPTSAGGSKYGTGPSSVPSTHKSPVDDVSNGKETHDPDMACNDQATHSHKGHVPGKAPETCHPPHPDETLNPEGYTGSCFVSKNRVFPACSADWKDNSHISVSTPERKDLVDDPEKLGLSAVFQDGPDLQDGIIGAREKHKESAEYKRATEEEWASRQRQLAIQAEEAKEAKRLRKRKKAEALRLLDMEKRQKQRIEEVRETERKREEDIQLKEQFRGALRLELENVERTCRDVSSILRALGIPVEGGEVKAYKKALMKFHPDRVSRTDIYQQVKAEETFKFISRFKEKLKL